MSWVLGQIPKLSDLASVKNRYHLAKVPVCLNDHLFRSTKNSSPLFSQPPPRWVPGHANFPSCSFLVLLCL